MPVVPFDSSRHADALALLITRATAEDGQPPFSDQALIEVRNGERRGLVVDDQGAVAGIAIVADARDAPAELELAVSPILRRLGFGSALVDAVIADVPVLLAWAHGDHAEARALAARYSFVPVRELLQLRLPDLAGVSGLSEYSTAFPGSGQAVPGTISPFRPGVDDAEWLAVNAAAFAGHPEQGSLQQHDLDARVAEAWFDAHDFLIARDRAGTMTGFCWLKVDPADEPPIGEVYAVGVAPDAQGSGLGRALVLAGLRRLVDRGVRTASLYVDGDNAGAVRLYRSLGFETHSIDLQYARTAPPPA